MIPAWTDIQTERQLVQAARQLAGQLAVSIPATRADGLPSSHTEPEPSLGTASARWSSLRCADGAIQSRGRQLTRDGIAAARDLGRWTGRAADLGTATSFLGTGIHQRTLSGLAWPYTEHDLAAIVVYARTAGGPDSGAALRVYIAEAFGSGAVRVLPGWSVDATRRPIPGDLRVSAAIGDPDPAYTVPADGSGVQPHDWVASLPSPGARTVNAFHLIYWPLP